MDYDKPLVFVFKSDFHFESFSTLNMDYDDELIAIVGWKFFHFESFSTLNMDYDGRRF